MTTKKRFNFKPYLLAGLLALSAGCAGLIDRSPDLYRLLEELTEIWDDWQSRRDDKKPLDPVTPPGNPSDAVDFSKLNWTYGGFKGGNASYDQNVRISGLDISSSGLSLKWDKGLDAWGLAHSDASALACLFVKKSDGSWVGGKFDWISTSRTTRSFSNINAGYNGWSLSGVPNPTEAALVIVSKDGSRRSNTLSGTWKR